MVTCLIVSTYVLGIIFLLKVITGNIKIYIHITIKYNETLLLRSPLQLSLTDIYEKMPILAGIVSHIVKLVLQRYFATVLALKLATCIVLQNCGTRIYILFLTCSYQCIVLFTYFLSLYFYIQLYRHDDSRK